MTDELRGRIIRGSVEALRERGLHGFSMEAAATLAGVSRKTIYNYFPSRFELLDAVFEANARETIESLAEIAANPGLDFVAKLNAITEQGFKRVREGSRLFRQGGGPSIHPRSAELYRELRRNLTAFIMRIVAEGAGLGLIRADIDPEKLTYVVINMVEGLLYLDDPEGEPFSRIDILQESIRVLLVGVASPAGAATLAGYSLFSRSEVTE